MEVLWHQIRDQPHQWGLDPIYMALQMSHNKPTLIKPYTAHFRWWMFVSWLLDLPYFPIKFYPTLLQNVHKLERTKMCCVSKT